MSSRYCLLPLLCSLSPVSSDICVGSPPSFINHQEEEILSAAFGQEWAAYAARTDSVLPGREAVLRIARMGTARALPQASPQAKPAAASYYSLSLLFGSRCWRFHRRIDILAMTSWMTTVPEDKCVRERFTVPLVCALPLIGAGGDNHRDACGRERLRWVLAASLRIALSVTDCPRTQSCHATDESATIPRCPRSLRQRASCF